jgi:uncharacterized membrane protein YidH (DUF202 family)
MVFTLRLRHRAGRDAVTSRDYNIAAQFERTMLAWNRTLLAIAANGTLG